LQQGYPWLQHLSCNCKLLLLLLLLLQDEVANPILLLLHGMLMAVLRYANAGHIMLLLLLLLWQHRLPP
jgi:hypothetical protein